MATHKPLHKSVFLDGLCHDGAAGCSILLTICIDFMVPCEPLKRLMHLQWLINEVLSVDLVNVLRSMRSMSPNELPAMIRLV